MSNELPFCTKQIVGMDMEVFLTFFGTKPDAPHRGAYNDYYIAVNRKENRIAAMSKEPLAESHPYPKFHVLTPISQKQD
jgi:hypothetical protein